MSAGRSVLLFGFEGFAFILLPLVPALIALYFLKLKRQQVVVSSTYLWKKSLEDLHVNSPFQKLRRSLLLLLQILALAGLVLAASKPIVSGSGAGGRNLLVLIDVSASMNAQEEKGTRRDLARKEALALVEGMGGGDRMAVITFADRTNVLRPLTADRAALRQSIEAIPQTSLPTDLLQALRTVEAIQKSLPAAETYLISDGALGTMGPLPSDMERFPLKFVGVGKAGENLGITELDVRRGFGSSGRVDLFASVHNFSGGPRKAALGLYLLENGQGRLLSAAELNIPAGRSASHTFDVSRLTADAGRALTLALEIDQGGGLKEDDRALVRVLPPARMEVLVVGGENPFLDRVLAVQSLIDARRVSLGEFTEDSRSGKLAEDPAKVLIFDRQAPGLPPDRPALYLGCAPPLVGPGVVAAPKDGGAAPGAEGGKDAGPVTIKAPLIVDWDRSHPVNRFLAFADLRIEESLAFSAGRGYRSLIDSSERSIVGTATFQNEGRPPVSALIVGFDLLKSNWPWLHSFPIFMGNALEWLAAAAGSDAEPRYRTGDILTYYPGTRKLESPVFRDPLGNDHPAVPERTGELSFAGTGLAGSYELRSGAEVLETYAVSLLNAGESEIAPRKEIRFGSQVVQAEDTRPRARDLWKWFALAALGLICLEWWVYNRRMHI